jgi:hypothetical protein
VRVREGDDLPAVRGIGQDLLVAREAGVEDDFASGFTPGAERSPLEDPTIFEDQITALVTLH